MKIIQSFWSKPALAYLSLLNDSRTNGGWISRKYYYISLTLSCLKLLEFYDKVELYTDQFGKKLLIDSLKLPYTNYHTALDNLSELYSEYLWTVGKLFVYGLQTEPFLHVDNDIFIWSRFDQRIEEADLVAQNPEVNQSYYKPVVDSLMKSFTLPKWLIKELGLKEKIVVSNTGVVGGNNFEFFKHYSNEALSLINANTGNLKYVSIGAFSVFAEQYLFCSLADSLNLNVEYLFNRFIDYKADPVLVRFEEIPYRNTYIHPVGSKQNYHLNKSVELTLRHEYPDYYFKLIRLLADNKL